MYQSNRQLWSTGEILIYDVRLIMLEAFLGRAN